MFGRKWMDTFMDKLAHKLTAQEMIKANAAADAEEMDKLKSQLKEYNECLAKMQKLIADGEEKLQGAEVNGEELNRLVEESINKIQEMQADTGKLDELKQTLVEKIGESNESVHKECVKVYRNVQAATVEENNKQTESLKEELAGSVKSLKGKLNAILGISIVALLASIASVVFQVFTYFNIKFF